EGSIAIAPEHADDALVGAGCDPVRDEVRDVVVVEITHSDRAPTENAEVRVGGLLKRAVSLAEEQGSVAQTTAAITGHDVQVAVAVEIPQGDVQGKRAIDGGDQGGLEGPVALTQEHLHVSLGEGKYLRRHHQVELAVLVEIAHGDRGRTLHDLVGD